MSSTAVTNPFQACNDIFLKPNPVFHALLSQQNWSWFPFLAVLIVAILPQYLYFGFVDIEWYQNLYIDATMADVSPAEKDMMRQGMTRGSMQSFSLIGTAIIIIAINGIIAAYLNVATKVDEENLNGFTDWYGFTWWTNMPSILAGLLSLAVIVTATDHQLAPQSLQPLTLSYWLGLDISSKWFGLGQFISLNLIWTVYLTTVGIGQWTKIPSRKATLIAVGPYAIIAGIWAIFAAL